MKRPNKDGVPEKKKSSKKSMVLSSPCGNDELNELSSKSLLANVLDINDDFIGNNKHQKNMNSMLYNPSGLNNRSNNKSMKHNSHHDPYLSNSQAYLKRENSNLSQSGAIMSFDSGGESGGFFSSSTSKTDINCVKRNLTAILKEIKAITQKIRDDEEDESKELSWKFAAMVIDRLCMVIFATLTIIITVTILMTSKNFFKSSDPHPVF
jgi:nicotinic acetylcholine receptor